MSQWVCKLINNCAKIRVNYKIGMNFYVDSFLAAGLPASSGRQYYSCRSPLFTPLPVMSVNGTIFFDQSYMFNLVQNFSNLF